MRGPFESAEWPRQREETAVQRKRAGRAFLFSSLLLFPFLFFSFLSKEGNETMRRKNETSGSLGEITAEKEGLPARVYIDSAGYRLAAIESNVP